MAARPERRDPISRLSRFCEIMALGLVAAALLMPFPNSLNRGGREGATITIQDVSGSLVQAAVVAVHTRTMWVSLAIISTIVAVAAYRNRHAAKAHRIACEKPPPGPGWQGCTKIKQVFHGLRN